MGVSMSLAIEIDKIDAVLLTDGTWYSVEVGTFTIDTYEFIAWPSQTARDWGDPETVQPGGHGGITPVGFRFCSDKGWIKGPLSSVMAIRDGEKKKRTARAPTKAA